MEFNTTEKEGILFLQIQGRLDATSSPLLDKSVNEFIESGKNKIVLCCQDLVYLSSAGLRLLLSFTKKLKANEGQFVLCNLSTDMMDIIRMAGFDHVLNFSTTEKEALKQLQ